MYSAHSLSLSLKLLSVLLFAPMTPPNNPVQATISIFNPKLSETCFNLSEDGNFSVKGVTLLSQVPKNVTFADFSSVFNPFESDAPSALVSLVESFSYRGGLLGFRAHDPSDRVMNSLGKFSDRNFLSIFRFKTWWSTQWVGKSGSDLQMETQWVLLDVPELGSYALILPLIEGNFRSALHPGDDEGQVMICAESGSTQVKESIFETIVYVHFCDNPYNLMKEAYTACRVYLNTFRVLEEKQCPTILNSFGWCTWDALFLTVDPISVWKGVSEFEEGGVPLKFLIIDDGWQSINLDEDDPHQDSNHLVMGGDQMTARMRRLVEGDKFRKYKPGSLLGPNPISYDQYTRPMRLISKWIQTKEAEIEKNQAAQSGGATVTAAFLATLDAKIERLKEELKEMIEDNHQQSNGICSYEENECGLRYFVKDLRSKFKDLDDIWVWQALCGAWGGVRPGKTHLNSKILQCKLSDGLERTMKDMAVDKIVEGGIGLVHPDEAEDFFDSLHSYLAGVGITGVKMDVIHTLEYVCEEYGGRVELAKRYYKGVTESLKKNFNGRNLLSSMQQCNDFFFLGTQQISMGRVGDDFWGQDPYGDPEGKLWLQGVHMVHCSYNSLWMGQMVHPDWDMFQSDHICADFHAGSRAICGGPIYVSDSLGCHDFDLLKKLVYPDGTIPRCQCFALPTRDCIFKNPLFDCVTALKIWNFNKYGGVIGAFNCQGSGWDPKEKRFKGQKHCYKTLETQVHVNDIEWDQNTESMEMGLAQECAVYCTLAGSLLLMTPKSEPISISLEPTSFELFTMVPAKQIIGRTARFSPIGLTNMYNCGGTIMGLEYKESNNVGMVIKGGGSFLAFSSESPKKCVVNGNEVAFLWFSDQKKLEFNVPWVEKTGGVSEAMVQF